MGGHGVDHSSDDLLRDLLLVVESALEEDADEIDRLAKADPK